MIYTDLDLAAACVDAYHDAPTYNAADCFALCFGPQDGMLRLAFRGSSSLRDWMKDLQAWPTVTSLGLLHHGFWNDGSAMWEKHIRPMRPVPSLMTAHSKGAPEMAIVAALMVANGWPAPRLVSFGCPRFVAGQGNSAHILDHSTGTHYRHGLDPVTEVPLELDHPWAMTELPRVDQGIDLVSDHLLGSYIKALSRPVSLAA